jgi:hypothetical protein
MSVGTDILPFRAMKNNHLFGPEIGGQGRFRRLLVNLTATAGAEWVVFRTYGPDKGHRGADLGDTGLVTVTNPGRKSG